MQKVQKMHMRYIVGMTLMVALAAPGCKLGVLDMGHNATPGPSPTPDMDMGVLPDMDPPDADMEVVIQPPAVPMSGETPMRLLTRYEYDNTVRDVFGLDAQEAQSFPSENLTNGFENNAWAHNVSSSLLRKYMEASEKIGARLVAERRAALIPCEPGAESAACANQAITDILPRAFRRPPTAEEAAIYQQVFTAALPTYGFDESMAMVFQAILQSPQFLYRLELSEQSMGQMPGAEGEFELVGAYEMASRLSYFLWASPPDALLLEAAEAGELATPEQIEAQVTRMLEDPKARAMSHQFFRQWLNMGKLDSQIKDAATYPAYDQGVNGDWRISLQAFLEDAFWDQGTFAALMTSPDVFYTPAMAPLYGVPVPTELDGGVFRVSEPGKRAGLLTQPALMAMLANTYQSSPILRGIFVRERLLCQHIPAAPNNIVIKPPDPDPTATTRERFRQHTEDPFCASCHKTIDPVGFGFESYDGVGAWRDKENGLTVDASGMLEESPEASLDGAFEGGVGLSAKLAASESVMGCMAEQWFQFAMGRPHDDSDAASVASVKAALVREGKWRDMLVAIALSDSFRYRKIEKEVSP
jgi:hypothetical protein